MSLSRKVLLGVVILLLLGGIGVAIAGDRALLFRASFIGTGAGMAERSGMSKLRDTVSVLEFPGCDQTGNTDSGACIQLAMNYIVANNGSTIYFPKGTYKYATPITIAGSSGIRLVGDTWDFQQTGGTTLLYTGTTSPAFAQLTSASNPSFEGLNFEYNNAGFSGTLVQLNGSDSAVFRRVAFLGRGVSTATYLLSLNNNSGAHILECQFDFAQYGLLGQATDGTGNANSAKVQATRFGGNIAIAHIRNVGQGWEVSGNDFEGGPGATFTGSIVTDAAVVGGPSPPNGIALHGNWFGDFVQGGGSPVIWVQFAGAGFSAAGNYMNCATTGTAIKFTTTTTGVAISGNHLRSCATGVEVGASIVSELSLTGNSFSSVTTPFSGTPAGHAFVQSPAGSVAQDVWASGSVQERILNGGRVQFNSGIETGAARTGTTSNVDLAGLVTLSVGAGTFSFNNSYATAPVCTCTDTTAANAVKCSTSTSTLTIAGTGSDVIAYHCVGRT